MKRPGPVDNHDPAHSQRPVILGVSLKLYFDIADTARWAEAFGAIAARRESVREGKILLFLLPSVTSLDVVARALRGTAVSFGAQDLHWADRGSYTGGVSGTDLREFGCRYVEVGHAERAAIFGESVEIAQSKFVAAVRNDLNPVLCIGEQEPMDAADAAAECVRQLQGYLKGVGHEAANLDLVVAYEPAWAIGKDEAAPPEYIGAVTSGLRQSLDHDCPFRESSVIYGGSAGQGTLSALDGAVDGLFLGRFAHDISALEGILDEAEELVGVRRR